MHLERIYARVYHTNIGSMKVLEKNGFTKEAVIKHEAFKANEFKDVHYYSMTREEFGKMNDFKI
jgi:ribosomal-protein-alanine N-acetyltransferase